MIGFKAYLIARQITAVPTIEIAIVIRIEITYNNTKSLVGTLRRRAILE